MFVYVIEAPYCSDRSLILFSFLVRGIAGVGGSIMAREPA